METNLLVAGFGGQGVMTLGKSKQKLEEEQMYYQCVFDIFDEIIA